MQLILIIQQEHTTEICYCLRERVYLKYVLPSSDCGSSTRNGSFKHDQQLQGICSSFRKVILDIQ